MLGLLSGAACSPPKEEHRPAFENDATDAAVAATHEGGVPVTHGAPGLIVPDDTAPETRGCTDQYSGAVGGTATCEPDQACWESQCLPACEAFAKRQGSMGCEFLAATPSVMTLYKPGCFAVFVANAGNRSAMIRVTRGEETFDVTRIGRLVGSAEPEAWPAVPATGVGPDQVAVLFLSHDPEGNSGDGTDTTCPVPPAVSGPGGAAVYGRSPSDSRLTPARQTGKGLAFSIQTDSPVSIYGILPFGGAGSVDPSATLLFPRSAWANNYIAVVPPKLESDEYNMQWGQILAGTDGTTVEIQPTTDLPAGEGVAAAPVGSVTRYQLNAGEFIQWQDSGEMTGSIILADHPIAFHGGSSELSYDSSQPECGNGASDNAQQQITPIAALGSKYVLAPYPSRIEVPESVPYRIVGLVDGTRLTYDPPLAVAPASLEVGSVADFEAVGAFTVQSQDPDHPFYVAQFMTGCGNGQPTGDEEFVNVVPAAQYLSKYVFFTDPTYPTTNLVLVRQKTESGFAEVEVDCLGTTFDWEDVGTAGEYQVARADLVRDGVGVGNCENGRHVSSSAGPFGLVVWGLANWASYAYPAGSGAAPINKVFVPPRIR